MFPQTQDTLLENVEEQESEYEVPTWELFATQTSLQHTCYIQQHVPISLTTHFHAVNCYVHVLISYFRKYMIREFSKMHC